MRYLRDVRVEVSPRDPGNSAGEVREQMSLRKLEGMQSRLRGQGRALHGDRQRVKKPVGFGDLRGRGSGSASPRCGKGSGVHGSVVLYQALTPFSRLLALLIPQPVWANEPVSGATIRLASPA